MRAKISAIITAYNRDYILSRAIDSVLNQTRPVDEILIIDDGSTDNTKNIVKKYEHQVKYIYQANRGVAGARNRGVCESESEWIAFLDSDDFWHPEYIEVMSNVIAELQGKAALFFCDITRRINHRESSHWKETGFYIGSDYVLNKDAAEWALLDTQPMMLQTSIIKRSAYNQIGGIPENLLTREDTYLFFRLAFRYPACAVNLCGAAMGGEAKNRLTDKYNRSGSIPYWNATIYIYQNLLQVRNEIKPEFQRKLIHSLSNSHLCMARTLIRQKHPIRGLIHILKSCKADPPKFFDEIYLSVRRRFYGPYRQL